MYAFRRVSSQRSQFRKSNDEKDPTPLAHRKPRTLENAVPPPEYAMRAVDDDNRDVRDLVEPVAAVAARRF
jgi:methyl coenzyme M reductase gamma subunit